MFKKTVLLSLMFCMCSFSAFGKTKCKDGQYFSASKKKCEDCPGNIFDPFYCAAFEQSSQPGDDYFNIKVCPNGKWFKKSDKKCVNGDKQECPAGQYLKEDGSGTCTGCGNLAMVRNNYLNWLNGENDKTKSMWKAIKKQYENNDDYPIKFITSDTAIASFYCPKVQNAIKQFDIPWGIKICQNGQVASDDKTKCVSPSSTNTKISCAPGEYLPGGATKCVRCAFDRKTGKVCKGDGTYTFDASKDQGITMCKSNQIVNSNGQSCIDCPSGEHKDFTECKPLEQSDDGSDKISQLANRTLSCNPGFYMMTKQEYIGRLKDNSTQSSLGNQTTKLEDVPYCMSCFDWGTNYSYGYKCPGVPNTKLTDKEQGKEYCTGGKVTTRENPNTCIDKPSSSSSQSSSSPSSEQSTTEFCPAGQVWVNGACQLCTSQVMWINYAQENRMYCPGVTDSSLPILKQLKKCPRGAWPNATLSDCDCKYGLKMVGNNERCAGQISSNDLYYGPNGKDAQLFKQCWTKVSEKAYKKCMGFDN